jgi:regulation of enolase protein 1 (concanavalin A-like superfamily)
MAELSNLQQVKKLINFFSVKNRFNSISYRYFVISIFVLFLILVNPFYGFCLQSDDFNSCGVKTELWELIDPLGGASFSIVGAGTGDSHLLFSVPAGNSHEPWIVNTAPRLMQPMDDTDFTIEVKFDSPVEQKYQEQGIIIEEDSNNYLRFDFYSDGSNTMIFAVSLFQGSPSVKINQTIQSGAAAPLYMRIERTGDDWVQSYSYDGSSWNVAVNFTHVIPVSVAGVFVGNYDSGGNAPDHTAVIDYFVDMADPIESEDGGSLPTDATLNMAVTGSGTVLKDPDQGTYGCGETVTLTAVPDTGYSFNGWSGDLSGQDNPITVVMNYNKSVTATFVLNATPPEISNIQVIPGQIDAIITWNTNELATGTIEYGETTNYEMGEVDNSDFAIEHSLVLPDLMPGTLYHYRITSENQAGLAASSIDLSLTTLVSSSESFDFQSDDFSDSSLNMEAWTLVDPLGAGSISILQDGTGESKLLFSVAGGSSHEPWIVNTAPRMVQSVSDIDFGVEIKFDSSFEQQYQEQGLIIEQDSNNYLRFDFYGDGSKIWIFAASILNGSASVKVHQPITPGLPLYMRIERSEDVWMQSYSYDGVNWNMAVSFQHVMAVNVMGPFVGNYSTGNAPPHTAIIDYIFNTGSPITPEDGNIVTTNYELNVSVTGPGTVLKDPDKSIYCCNEPVTLTAVPDPGYSFSGWIGDLSGQDNPATLAMNSNMSITATFEEMTTSQPEESTDGPLIDIWYGPEQTFGSIGIPQRWVNILGNVSDANGVNSLTYSLNSGPEFSLNMGPSNLRLDEDGDFNIEIAYTDLQEGQNNVIIRALDNLGDETIEDVIVNYESGNVWPESYTIDWASVSSISDVAQIVDGKWVLESNSIRSVEPGYDRLIAIGDLSWTDYEVTVPITIHGIEVVSNNNLPGVGLLVRWQGHIMDGNQPSTQWWPLGVFAHYRFYDYGVSLRMLADQWSYLDSNFYSGLEYIGVQYIFKLRCETVAG